jgi:hypothetical protein
MHTSLLATDLVTLTVLMLTPGFARERETKTSTTGRWCAAVEP